MLTSTTYYYPAHILKVYRTLDLVRFLPLSGNHKEPKQKIPFLSENVVFHDEVVVSCKVQTVN